MLSKLKKLIRTLTSQPKEITEIKIGVDRWQELIDKAKLYPQAIFSAIYPPDGMIPTEIGKLTHLEYFVLYDYKGLELPDSICNLTNLKDFAVSNDRVLNDLTTRLSRLPENFGALTKLETIKLSRCNLSELPESFCNLNNLRYLDLQHNENLQNFPDNFQNLTSLKKIDLFGVKLSDRIINTLKVNNFEKDVASSHYIRA